MRAPTSHIPQFSPTRRPVCCEFIARPESPCFRFSYDCNDLRADGKSFSIFPQPRHIGGTLYSSIKVTEWLILCDWHRDLFDPVHFAPPRLTRLGSRPPRLPFPSAFMTTVPLTGSRSLPTSFQTPGANRTIISITFRATGRTSGMLGHRILCLEQRDRREPLGPIGTTRPASPPSRLRAGVAPPLLIHAPGNAVRFADPETPCASICYAMRIGQRYPVRESGQLLEQFRLRAVQVARLEQRNDWHQERAECRVPFRSQPSVRSASAVNGNSSAINHRDADPEIRCAKSG